MLEDLRPVASGFQPKQHAREALMFNLSKENPASKTANLSGATL